MFACYICYLFLAIKCNQPLKMTNNLTYTPAKQTFSFNVSVQFHCDEGFNIKGSSFATCSENSTFMYPNGQPYCEGIHDIIVVIVLIEKINDSDLCKQDI